MYSLEYTDMLIGEALEQLTRAAAEIKNQQGLDARAFLLKIGGIISAIWAVRDEIYKINPDIKRDFVAEYENDSDRYESLNQLYNNA
ncbi:MAG: hypothetical protein AB1921_03110, partial [Thermodesulfobacteriota bacterium]